MSCLHINKHTYINKHSLPIQGASDSLKHIIPWKKIIFSTMTTLLRQCSLVLTVVINRMRVTEGSFDSVTEAALSIAPLHYLKSDLASFCSVNNSMNVCCHHWNFRSLRSHRSYLWYPVGNYYIYFVQKKYYESSFACVYTMFEVLVYTNHYNIKYYESLHLLLKRWSSWLETKWRRKMIVSIWNLRNFCDRSNGISILDFARTAK